jgi:Domain of unknown function (DUF4476)
MTRFILSLLIVLSFSAAFSQKQYFIYLQSEPEHAFFIKVNEKIHTSSSSGYLILSKLRDSSYNFSVGFPQNKWPEQKFTVDIKAKDHGYLLKNFGETGWGLFDLQTLAIQMSLPAANTASQKTEQREVSAFTDILSKAANDPSLKEKPVTPPPVVIKEETKPAIGQTVIKKDEPPVVKKEEPPVITKEQPTVKTEEVKTIPVEEYKRSVVTKKSESSTSEGLGLTFIDDYGNGKKDTIRILIPNPKINIGEVKEIPKEEKKFLDITENDTVKKKEPVLIVTKPADLPVAVAKNNCLSIASDNDFLKLRKKMAAETKDDGMIDEAKKQFKTKCFTVSQIKNLSALFLNDNGKYNFFDAAYMHVSDPENFSSLAAELKDEYYINRFKAMLR